MVCKCSVATVTLTAHFVSKYYFPLTLSEFPENETTPFPSFINFIDFTSHNLYLTKCSPLCRCIVFTYLRRGSNHKLLSNSANEITPHPNSSTGGWFTPVRM